MDNPSSGGCSIALVFLLGLMASALLLFAFVPAGENASDSATAPDIIVITSEAPQIQATVSVATPVFIEGTPNIIVATAVPK